MSSVILIDPEILSGTPVFSGTRVPIRNLFDYIQGGHPLSEFLDDFPSVTRQQVEKLFVEFQKDATRNHIV